MADDEGDTAQESASLGAQALGAGVGGLAGLAASGLSPAAAVVAAGATPYLTAWAQRALNELRGRDAASVASMMGQAAARLDGDPDDVLAAALATPEGNALLSDAVRAASETADERKIAALAKALANGLVSDDAQIDEERLVVLALAGVETPHLKILATLPSSAGKFKRYHRSRLGTLGVLQGLGMAVDDAHEAARAQLEKQAKQVNDMLRALARAQDAINAGRRPPVQHKSSTSPLSEFKTDQGPKWRRTPFGDRCMAYLLQASTEVGVDSSDLRPGRDNAGREHHRPQ